MSGSTSILLYTSKLHAFVLSLYKSCKFKGKSERLRYVEMAMKHNVDAIREVMYLIFCVKVWVLCFGLYLQEQSEAVTKVVTSSFIVTAPVAEVNNLLVVLF
jgi:hypothetical protein